MVHKEAEAKIVKAHHEYYASVEGPIGGRDRFEWVAKFFFKETQGKRILEIGCGEGSLLELLSLRNQVWGVDISSTGVQKTKEKGIPCCLADVSNDTLPFEDSFFDQAICLETIEHVENPHRMVWEIKRVLKDGGALLISIPSSKILHPYIYPGLFTRKNFSEFLRLNGFEIKRIVGWGQAAIFNRLSKTLRDKNSPFLNKAADFIFYISRKRNLLLRKHLGTPLAYAFCLNFECINFKRSRSRAEEVAYQTTPK